MHASSEVSRTEFRRTCFQESSLFHGDRRGRPISWVFRIQLMRLLRLVVVAGKVFDGLGKISKHQNAQTEDLFHNIRRGRKETVPADNQPKNEGIRCVEEFPIHESGAVCDRAEAYFIFKISTDVLIYG